MKSHADYLAHKLQVEKDQDSPGYRKLFLRLAHEMHLRFPEYTLAECYKIARERHLLNRDSIKLEKEMYLKQQMEKEKPR